MKKGIYNNYLIRLSNKIPTLASRQGEVSVNVLKVLWMSVACRTILVVEAEGYELPSHDLVKSGELITKRHNSVFLALLASKLQSNVFIPKPS